MLADEKRNLKSIGKIELFDTAIEKLTTNSQLEFREKSFLLSSAILFLSKYQKDNRFSSYADFAYYIILKYSLVTQDFKPLYDISVNLGFYPVAKFILSNNLIGEVRLDDIVIDLSLNNFKNKDEYIETLEQHHRSEEFLTDDTNEKCYLAPTSFGKSALIVRAIQELDATNTKIVIIVPTKSLLMQTFRLIRSANLGVKIIMHDEMYDDDESFIGVFTQERSLRLMNRKKLYYDVLFVDEAHNILKGDSRSVLLSRLIHRNRKLNPEQKVVYLSPLVDSIENLKVAGDQIIQTHTIERSIKEPDIYEYRTTGECFIYNRFVDKFYPIERHSSMLSYILGKSKSKNFIYNYRPIKIEALAKELCTILPKIDRTTQIGELKRILKREVHSKFYAVNLLDYGVIYLHGKLPDTIKEYLEEKYRILPEIRYVIANSVILEGMNLPIDNLFILNTHGLKGKELMNLIGRVNRLNEIFLGDEQNIHKLTPSIHFVNNEQHNRRDGNMKNQIKLLRSRIFDDKVENPLLASYDLEKILKTKKDKTKYRKEVSSIQENERFLTEAEDTDSNELKKYLIESGIIDHYNTTDLLRENIAIKIEQIRNTIRRWDSYSMLNKIHFLFIQDNIEIINDEEVKRLHNIEARNYYENFITIKRKKSLNENVGSQLEYFKDKASSNEPLFYFGPSYGEVAFEEGGHKKIFVNLSEKSETELINLAIVKLKMEEDFISYKLNKFIVMLYDYGLISKDEYNLYIYGTNDMEKIELTKYGLSISLINRLAQDGQIENLSFDQYNNLVPNEDFQAFLGGIDDFYRYEVKRFISS